MEAKTKEEIITEEAKKAFMHYFIHRGNKEDINWDHEKSHWFTSVVSKYIENAYSAGFEAFREKVEREVKKLQGNDQSFEKINSTIKTVLTTIKDIRE